MNKAAMNINVQICTTTYPSFILFMYDEANRSGDIAIEMIVYYSLFPRGREHPMPCRVTQENTKVSGRQRESAGKLQEGLYGSFQGKGILSKRTRLGLGNLNNFSEL